MISPQRILLAAVLLFASAYSVTIGAFIRLRLQRCRVGRRLVLGAGGWASPAAFGLALLAFALVVVARLNRILGRPADPARG